MSIRPIKRSLNNYPNDIRRRTMIRRKFCSHAKSRSIFHRRLKRRNFRPSCVFARLRLRLCGAINSMSSFCNCSSSGSESYALSPIIFCGRSSVNRSLTVGSTSLTGVAAPQIPCERRGGCTKAVLPLPGASFLQPRLVFPTLPPLFWRRQRFRQ